MLLLICHLALFSGDITENGYQNMKAKIADRFTTKEVAQPVANGVSVSRELGKPKESMQKAIVQVFGKGKASGDSMTTRFNPSGVIVKEEKVVKKKSLSKGKTVNVVCLDKPTLPHEDRRQMLQEAGMVKDVILHRTVTAEEVDTKLSSAFPGKIKHQQYVFQKIFVNGLEEQ